MTTALHLLDPDPSPAWAPFAGVRPLCELRAGAHLVRERWEAFFGTVTTSIMALPHLAGFPETDVPPVGPVRPVQGPAVIGSSTFAPRGLAPPLPDAPVRLTHGGITVGWAVPAGSEWSGPLPPAGTVEVAGVLLHSYGMYLRLLISGRPPVTNMYESVIFVAWGAVVFALIFEPEDIAGHPASQCRTASALAAECRGVHSQCRSRTLYHGANRRHVYTERERNPEHALVANETDFKGGVSVDRHDQ